MSGTTPDFEFLRNVPIFKGLTDEALKTLLSSSTKALFHKGSDIFTIGDKVKNLYLVEIGEIEIYKYSLEGKKLHLWYCRRGDIFCLPSLYTEQVFTNATATQDSLLFVIPKIIVEKLLKDSPSFASDLLRCISSRIMCYSLLVDELAFKGLKERLANILWGSREETEEGIICRLSLSEMAAYLGTCEEVVSRILKEFRKEGAISRLGKKRLLLYPEKFNKS